MASACVQNLVQFTQHFFGARGEQTRGKLRESGVSIANFARPSGQRFFVTRDCGEIAASDWAGPGYARAEAFEIRERLANQRHKSHFRTTARESATHQNANGAFDDGEKIRRSESSGGVIGGLGAGAQRNGKASDGARDASGGALRAGIALNGEDDAVERSGGASGESLQRMHRAGGGAELCERREFAFIESAAGVQNDFAAPFFAADAREFGGDFMNRGVGRGDENNVGMKNAAADAGVRMSRADGANGGARGGLRASDDSADFPIEFAKAAGESAAKAS
jgi:hypothetical protein